MNRRIRLLLFFLFIMLVCTACFKRENEIDPLKEEKVTLKIFTNQKSFVENRYIDVLRLYFPKLNLIVVNEGYDEARESGDWKTWLDYHQPDLIMSFGKEMYQQLIEEELVIALEPYIANEDYSFDRFLPGPIEWLRIQSPDNQLYGLATEFYNEFIYYNKEHFDNLKIPYPNVHTNWKELLQISRRFQNADDGIIGIQTSQNMYPPLEIIYEVAFAEGLNLLDMQKKEVYIGSEAWKEIFEEVISTVTSGSIQEFSEIFPGNTALVFSNNATEFNKLNFAEEALHEKWEIINYPVNIHEPNVSHKLRVDYPFSIYSNSLNKDLAWQLLKFIAGPEMARYEQNVYPKALGFPIWIDYIERSQLENKHVFYDVMPTTQEIPYYREEFKLIHPMMQQKIDAVISGNQELDKALLELESEIERLLADGEI